MGLFRKKEQHKEHVEIVIHPPFGAPDEIMRYKDNGEYDIPNDRSSNNIRSVILDSLNTAKLLLRQAFNSDSYPDKDLTAFGEVRYLWPKADSRSCPYCGIIFDKSIKRAQRCKTCGCHVNVRAGLILTDQQIIRLNTWRDRAIRIRIASSNIDSAESNFACELYILAVTCLSAAYCQLGVFDKSWRLLTNSDVVAFARMLDGMDGWNATLELWQARVTHGDIELQSTRAEADKAKKAATLAWINAHLLLESLLCGKDYDDYRVEGAAREINRLSEVYKLKIEDIIDKVVERPDANYTVKTKMMDVINKKRSSFIV